MPRAVKITLKLWLKLYKLNSETETELRKLILGLIKKRSRNISLNYMLSLPYIEQKQHYWRIQF